ncbi:MAG: GAF domain-containing protein, partial [Vicinamibacterales bacterium]|nr:GAF domain-containing protein [Vicinamibacterales bacterium]
MTERTAARPASDAELLSTLSQLGREVASVLDLHELLVKVPTLIARLTAFTAFGAYLLDEATQTLSVAYSIGYPEHIRQELRVGQGVVGASVEQGAPILVADVDEDPRYRGLVPGMHSQLAVPLRRKGRVVGALNLLSDRPSAFTTQDEALLRQFAAHVAVAIENARLFESERQLVTTLETLADIGREVSAILDLDELLTRIASLTKRIVKYRTFGIFLVNESGQQLDLKLAVRYGNEEGVRHIPLGQGLVGWAAQHRQVVRVSDVSQDPRYIAAVEDVRSELVIPLLI